MYEFRDVTDHTARELPLPAEAVSIDGQYIEKTIDGYRTLYTKGRESLGVEINAYSVANASGERLSSTRYPARTLTVGFQLIAHDPETFVESFNTLKRLLSVEVADFIFNDETDKFFTGTPIMDAEVEAGELSVKGEWHIFCAYPFKRSVNVKTLTMSDAVINGNTASWGIDYKGVVPAKPVMRAKFAPSTGGSYSEDGDCGYVAFSDKNGNIIQLGNPSIINYDDGLATITLMNENMTSLSGWNTTGGSGVPLVDGTMSIQNITDANWNNGEGLTRAYAVPTYGSSVSPTTKERGCVMWKNLSESATDFELKLMHKFCVANMGQTGSFHCYLQDANNNIIAGFKMLNDYNTTNTDIQFFVKGAITRDMVISGMKYSGASGYGYSNKVLGSTVTKKAKINGKFVRKVCNEWIYTTPDNLSVIRKHGNTVTFRISGREAWDFKTDDRTPITKITMFFGAFSTMPYMDTNAVASVSLQKILADSFADIPNVFLAGDVVEADCNDASVTLYRDGAISGYDAPQYGALGNQWENFELTRGVNAIQATWSDWVDPNYIPQIEIDYNEVFL